MTGLPGGHYVPSREEVLAALIDCQGDRDLAGQKLGKSERTINRYIAKYNLFPDLDRLGFIHHSGPPRLRPRGSSKREPVILAYLRRKRGHVDHPALARTLYSNDDEEALQRVYTALYEMKIKKLIATDGDRYLIVGEPYCEEDDQEVP